MVYSSYSYRANLLPINSIYTCFHFSPASYSLFNYIYDLISSVTWFGYILAVYCIVYLAFNGSPKNSSSPSTALEFATPWDLRVQFYPLAIIIALPTLPFVYLITKLFKSDIIVCFFLRCVFVSNHIDCFSLVRIGSFIHIGHHSFGRSHCANRSIHHH